MQSLHKAESLSKREPSREALLRSMSCPWSPIKSHNLASDGAPVAERRIERVKTSPRSAADIVVLLDDLNRILGAFAGYEFGHAKRTMLLERALMLWCLEIERAGPIELVRNGKDFYCGALGQLECRYLGKLVCAMEIHDVRTLRVVGELDQEGLNRFTSLLALPTNDLDQMCEGKFAGRLYASTSAGIEVNGQPRVEEPAGFVPALPEARRGMPFAPIAAHEPLPTHGRNGAFAPQAAWPQLEEDPFEAPSMTMQGDKLRLALRQLDRCDDDLLYDALSDKIIDQANELWSQGHCEEGYRAMLVLTDHASDADRTAEPRARMAQAALEALTNGERIEFIVGRGRDCKAGGVRPAQVLLQIGERAVPVILDALDAETDPRRSDQLAAMIVALGEHSVAPLNQCIARRSGSRLQLAVRLAGQLQSPKLVPTLASVLEDSGPALRREAGMALVSIGNQEACGVLVKALGQGGEELALTAARCLGMLGEDQTIAPLRTALDAAVIEARDDLGRVIIGSLHQLNIAAGPMIEILEAVVETTHFKDPNELRLTKCAALEVLGTYHESDARNLVMSATKDADRAVSSKAHAVMNQLDRCATD